MLVRVHYRNRANRTYVYMSVCIYRETHTSDRQERERKTESKRARDRGKDDEEDR